MLIASRRLTQTLSVLAILSLVVSLADARHRVRPSSSHRIGKRTPKKGSTARSWHATRARARGRRVRGHWRRRVARANVSSYQAQARIQSSFTEAWSAAQAAPPHGSGGRLAAETGGPSPVESEPPPPPLSNNAANNGDRAPTPQPGSLAEPSIPVNPLVAAYTESLAARGYSADGQGLIVETMKGEVLAEHNADRPFNPASVVKIATSLVAIARLGPDFRFRTYIYTAGRVDPATSTLNGSLYVVGSGDPAFFYENAMLIADQLNRNGIHTINGELVVQGQFYFNFSASREASAHAFLNTLSPEKWTPAMKDAYPRFLSMRAAEDLRIASEAAPASEVQNTRPRTVGNNPQVVQSAGFPSLRITGELRVEPSVNTSGLQLLAVHTSLPLVRVLKVLNDFSNNWMATVIGNLVGGPDAVDQFLQNAIGLKPEETRIATASGLGTNLISPRGTLRILRKLIAYLEKEGLGIEDLLPVAGVDAGTLEKRFTDQFRASVVAKTGTLGSQGVSALAGVAYTKLKGPVLFVIYNRGGSAASFRAAQDETIRKLITLHGGPTPVHYSFTNGPRLVENLTPPK